MFKRSLFILSTVACLSIGVATQASAQDEFAEALAALDAQLPGTLINNPYNIQWKTEGSDRSEKIVESEGAPGGMAYQVRIKKRKPNPWDTAIRIPMTVDIEKDEVIMVSFWARAAKPPKGKETGDIMVALQRNVDPYDSILEERIDLGTEWKLYSAAGTASRKYSADKTQLNFNLARAKQTIEFGQFYLMNLGEGADASKYMSK